MIRGQLELVGITTVDALAGAAALTTEPGRDRAGRARTRGLRDTGFVHTGRDRGRVGVAPPPRAHACVLAQAPARPGRAGDGPGLHALRAAVAAPRARHPARRHRRTGQGHQRPAGLGSGGRGVGARARRAAGCATTTRTPSTGSATRARSGGYASRRVGATSTRPPAHRTRRRRSRSCSAPISRGCSTRRATASTPMHQRPARPQSCSNTSARNGACFAAELIRATGRLPEDVERGLWDGVSRGLFTADGFGAIRSRVDKHSTPEPARLSRLMRGAATAPVRRRTLVARPDDGPHAIRRPSHRS